MDRQHTRQLAARFIAEAEADINYGLAEDLDPHHEYAVLAAGLWGKEISQIGRSPGNVGVESGVISRDDETSRDRPESSARRRLARSRTGL